jgi:hypothetical protein
MLVAMAFEALYQDPFRVTNEKTGRAWNKEPVVGKAPLPRQGGAGVVRPGTTSNRQV